MQWIQGNLQTSRVSCLETRIGMPSNTVHIDDFRKLAFVLLPRHRQPIGLIGLAPHFLSPKSSILYQNWKRAVVRVSKEAATGAKLLSPSSIFNGTGA